MINMSTGLLTKKKPFLGFMWSVMEVAKLLGTAGAEVCSVL